MQRFKSSLQAQRFLSAHAFIYGHFHPRRHRMAANRYRASRAMAFKVWQQETCTQWWDNHVLDPRSRFKRDGNRLS
jgi:putative transposase